MKVLKFGGTSVRDAAAMRKVAEILRSYSGPLVVVLSAVSGTTDGLLKMVGLASRGEMKELSLVRRELETKHQTIIKELGLEVNDELKKEIKEYFVKIEILLLGIYYLREITPRASAAIVSHGELLSTKIFAAFLKAEQLGSTWFDVRQVMKTDNRFTAAVPEKELLKKLAEEKLRSLASTYSIIVTQGFIGSDAEGLTTTLGRGGSDYSAALLGFALEADAIEIWTDVSGVLTADPRIVENTVTQHDLSFREAAELAYFGAKVLHPSTILPAMEKEIPVVVKNTLKPDDAGTVITSHSKRPGQCKAIAFRDQIMILTVESSRMLMAYGFLEKIFEVFARHEIAVDLISTSEISVSLTIDNSQFDARIVEKLSEFSTVKVTRNMAVVSIVGENIKASPGFLGKAFNALNDIPVEMITFGSSNVNLSLVVPDDQLNTCVRRLHSTFFENKIESE